MFYTRTWSFQCRCLIRFKWISYLLMYLFSFYYIINKEIRICDCLFLRQLNLIVIQKILLIWWIWLFVSVNVIKKRVLSFCIWLMTTSFEYDIINYKCGNEIWISTTDYMSNMWNSRFLSFDPHNSLGFFQITDLKDVYSDQKKISRMVVC